MCRRYIVIVIGVSTLNFWRTNTERFVHNIASDKTVAFSIICLSNSIDIMLRLIGIESLRVKTKLDFLIAMSWNYFANEK